MPVNCLNSSGVESICVLKATHNTGTSRRGFVKVESICVLKATHNKRENVNVKKWLKVFVF